MTVEEVGEAAAPALDVAPKGSIVTCPETEAVVRARRVAVVVAKVAAKAVAKLDVHQAQGAKKDRDVEAEATEREEEKEDRLYREGPGRQPKSSMPRWTITGVETLDPRPTVRLSLPSKKQAGTHRLPRLLTRKTTWQARLLPPTTISTLW